MRTLAAAVLACSLLALRPVAARALAEDAQGVGPTRPAARLVHVSGPIRLTGSGYAAQGTNLAVVTLTGTVDVSDAEGRVRSGPTNVTIKGVVDVTKGLMDEWAHPTVFIYIERDGRVSGARLDGNIPFSGTARSGVVSLTGAGLVSGDVLVDGR